MVCKDLLGFFHEAGFLKSVPRSGWHFIGNKNPESVAEHSFRTSIIGYFLAKQEGADANMVVKACLFHDLSETRLGDFNKVNKRYIDKKSAEKECFDEIVSCLPEGLASELKSFRDIFGSETKEGIVSKDADLVECALQAKEYIDYGYELAWDWISNAGSMVKTETAKKLINQLQSNDSSRWWQGLKKLED